MVSSPYLGDMDDEKRLTRRRRERAHDGPVPAAPTASVTGMTRMCLMRFDYDFLAEELRRHWRHVRHWRAAAGSGVFSGAPVLQSMRPKLLRRRLVALWLRLRSDSQWSESGC